MHGYRFSKEKKRNPARQESSPTGNLKTLKKNFRDSNDTDSTRLMLIRLPRSCKEGRRIRTLRFNSSDQRQWSKSGLIDVHYCCYSCMRTVLLFGCRRATAFYHQSEGLIR